jgi:hypothetical protein
MNKKRNRLPADIPMIWTGESTYHLGDGAAGIQRPIMSFGHIDRSKSRKAYRIKAVKSWKQHAEKLLAPAAAKE